jgi:replicative DNA helicase
LLERGKALYVFAGETNVGKSIVLGNIATNVVLQGKTVLLITLEMSELVYATRLCSNITQIPIRDLRTDQQSLRSIMNMEKEKGGKLLIKEFPPSSITPAGLKSFVADIIASGIKIDCIVVDYINLLHSTIGSNSYERVKYITEQLRALSYFTNAPMVSATQLNRGGFGGKNPGLDTISESIGLAATADVIVMIFQSEEDRELNIIRFGLGKNRYGPKGMVYPMNMQYETLTIRDNGGEEEVMTDNALDSLEIFGE